MQQQVIEDWRTKLTALLELTYDEGERAILQEAEMWIQRMEK
jgi:hypothetical protein